MSLCQSPPSAEGRPVHQQTLPASGSSTLELVDDEFEDDEYEDEDADFNPFIKDAPSAEASSSLSSAIEGLDANVVESGGAKSISVDCTLSQNVIGGEKYCAIRDSKHAEQEFMTQCTISPSRTCEKAVASIVPRNLKKATLVLTSQVESYIVSVSEKDDGQSNDTDVFNDGMDGESNNTANNCKADVDLDDNDAICRRTRARYSLASFTLDELETFLQESDDDDTQNVDDQEEYRKFLAAVLQGGNGDGKTIQECGNIDDEDEDNDADFQIEIEEALESDLDENLGETQKEEYELSGHRPVTRQNRHQKTAFQNQKKVLGQTNRRLCPILPFPLNASFTTNDVPLFQYPVGCDNNSNQFSPYQIGQLHCLIYEHVQLLIQVFSLCVLEPSQQNTASLVQEMISEMLDKQGKVLAHRRMPYPSSCFHPSYLHPSVPDEVPKAWPPHFNCDSTLDSTSQQRCSSENNKMTHSQKNSASKLYYTHIPNGQASYFQSTGGTFWVPCISGPVLSILDVAPLSLVGKYMDDVSAAKRQYRKCQLEGTCDLYKDREPLFPLPNYPSISEANVEASEGLIHSNTGMVTSLKKTLAAQLVESTKQSIALVYGEIAKLAQRFISLFNPALYPRKPPPLPLTNRVLFTEAEDELLALGLMEFNTDWKAIQQRFLPCKSEHQIFVRQKNRSSSKAPDNPIKAVRKMKTSPLTAKEIACIREGLKAFYHDWVSIWKFIVPYRDPSLLPRQWRIALGTQKSYKSISAKKEKRQSYFSKKKCEAVCLPSGQAASTKEDNQIENDGGNNSGDDCIDKEDEAYVHEAFLADWRPSNPGVVSPNSPFSNLTGKSQTNVFLSQDIRLKEQTNNNNKFRESLPQKDHTNGFLAGCCASSSMKRSCLISDLTLKSSKSQFCLRPSYRGRKSKNARLVKLAPDLPPVNLPPSGRVFSQSAFKSFQTGASSKNSPVAGICNDAGTESIVPRISHAAGSLGNNHLVRDGAANALKYDAAEPHAQVLEMKDQSACEERGIDSDLQMHPLLFQAPKDGHLPYYPMNCSSGTSVSFSFSENLPQLNLSLFHNSPQANPTVKCLNEPSKTMKSTLKIDFVDFHPLLKRADDGNGASSIEGLASRLCVDKESVSHTCKRIENFSDPVTVMSQPINGPVDASDKPFSPDGKECELDLEIHLSCSMSRKENAAQNGNVIEHNEQGSTGSASISGTIMETQNANPCFESENRPVGSISNRICDKHGLGANKVCIPNGYTIDNANDQSLPGIVMEQEELSDSSDEELGEHVEFECEEMADSEEEGSDCEWMTHIQKGDAPNVASEKLVTDGHDLSNVCAPLKGHGQAKDTDISLQLHLKTGGPGCHAKPHPKNAKRRIEEHPTGKNVSPSSLKRPCKKPKLLEKVSHATTEPKKRTCRSNTYPKMASTVESSGIVGSDKNG